jgi:hypothetical protein
MKHTRAEQLGVNADELADASRSAPEHGRATFGDRHPDGLHKVELEDWREQLPGGSRHDVFRAFRRALARAVDRQLATENASDVIRNPKRKRHERRDVLPFETWADVEAVADELNQRYRANPVGSFRFCRTWN